MSSLLLLPVAWVPVPFGFRWSLPADSRSYEGLGGGIAWALDPAFCEQLLPSFHEDAPTSRYYRFVDCDEIKDAFVRAMSTWAGAALLPRLRSTARVRGFDRILETEMRMIEDALEKPAAQSRNSRLCASDAAADAERSRSLDSHECSLEC